MHRAVLFATKRVLDAANRVLNLSGNLFTFAFSFELGIIPVTLPMTSFTAPLACCADPLIRSLSM